MALEVVGTLVRLAEAVAAVVLQQLLTMLVGLEIRLQLRLPEVMERQQLLIKVLLVGTDGHLMYPHFHLVAAEVLVRLEAMPQAPSLGLGGLVRYLLFLVPQHLMQEAAEEVSILVVRQVLEGLGVVVMVLLLQAPEV